MVENLGMQNMCAKMLPRLLTIEQKARRPNVSQDIFQRPETDDKILKRVITGDESWTFQYDPEIKRKSCQWKAVDSSRPKKPRMLRSKMKVLLITFLTTKARCIVCLYLKDKGLINTFIRKF